MPVVKCERETSDEAKFRILTRMDEIRQTPDYANFGLAYEKYVHEIVRLRAQIEGIIPVELKGVVVLFDSERLRLPLPSKKDKSLLRSL